MIQANFNAYANYVTDSLYQWDIDQVLRVTGLNLTTAPEVHFSNVNMDRAIVRQAEMVNHVVTVDIPNSLLQEPLRIYAHIGIYEGKTFKIVEVVEIPVIARKRPLDYQIADSDEELYSFKALENALNNKANNTDTEALGKRIDNIVANANSTEGNSELVDVRYGADGTIYTSAGEAVRGQIGGLTDKTLSNVPAVGKIVSGAYVSATGSIISNAAFSYVESSVVPGAKIVYKCNIDNDVTRLAFYDADGVMIVTYPCATDAQYITVPENARSLKATYNKNTLLTLVEDVGDILGEINALKTTAETAAEVLLSHYLTFDLINGAYIRVSDGKVVTHASYNYLEIPAIPGATILYTYDSNQSMTGIAFYDENNAFISGALAIEGTQALTIPENAVIVRATAKSVDGVVINNAAREIARGISILAKKVGVMGAAVDGATTLPSIHVPAKSVAVVGHEWNMYFDNIIRCKNIKDYNVRATVVPGIADATVYDDCLRLTPTTAGEHTVTVSICDKFTNEVVVKKSFTLYAIADTIVSGKKVIFIGDSLTDTAIYPAEIQHNLSGGGITSLGTREGTPTVSGEVLNVNHEGRGGWSVRDYFKASVDGVINPFYNPETSTFDFSYYMTEQGYSDVDIVSIFLGTNGVHYEDNVSGIQTMIDSIHEYNSDIVILVALINMPATQNGWGYKCGTGSAYDFKFDAMNLNDAYITSFEGVADNVDIAEVYFALDTVHDYGTIMVPASARNPVEIEMQTNNVHPNGNGYLKFADVIYNNILYHLTK